MARLLTMDACTVALRNALLAALRPEDEGLLLPQAGRSVESGVFKNVTFRLAGDSGGISGALFSHDWFSGVSVVQLSSTDALALEQLLEGPNRAAVLEKLAAAVPSDVADPDLQVGPVLACDEYERDVAAALPSESDAEVAPQSTAKKAAASEWIAGFDSPSAFVGVFAAQNSRPPEVGTPGTNRVHNELFLVCKAGAGIAASTFHSRFLSAIATPGATLDSVLGEGGTVGATSLRRLAAAGSRNRARILHTASEVLRLSDVQSVGDQASRNKYRGVVADIDIVVNSLRKLEEDGTRSVWQLTNAIDGGASKGLVSLSNASDGMLLYLNTNGDKRIILKQNESWGSVPYATQRIVSEREMVDRVLAARGVNADRAWISKRFAWRNREFSATQPDVLPFAFFGSHATETFSKTFGRELGLAPFSAVRLRPELVACAGVNSGKLRALVGSLGRDV